MNPYFEERIAAFIDILGFKEKVKRSIEDRDCAEALHSSLKYILQLRKDNENWFEIGIDNLSITVLSIES